MCYASLWDTNSPARKHVNSMVFHEYYAMLKTTIEELPRLSTETVDLYDSRLNFMADSHRIYLRSKRTIRDDWAPSWFRMTAQDVENVIRGFDNQWQQEYEDTTPLPTGSAETDPMEKGKDKMDTQAAGTEEAPLPGVKRKKPAGGPAEVATTKKKKKHKATKPASQATLTDEDYELIATRTSDVLKDTLDAMREQKEKIQSAVEKQQQDLKVITEKTSAVHIPSPKATAKEAATSSISREEGLAKDRLNTVLIPPGSIRLPAMMKDPPA